MNATEAAYTYKVGMDVQTRGTTVFTALLVEALVRHYGANSYTTSASYPSMLPFRSAHISASAACSSTILSPHRSVAAA